jgi:hypothetical protein
MNSFFSVFGKVMLAVLLVGVLVGGGIMIGKKMNPAQPVVTVGGQKDLPSETPTTTAAIQPTGIVSPSDTPTPTANTQSKVSVTGVSPFVSFTMTVATPGWVSEQTTLVDRPKLTLTNGAYKLTISQGAGGAGQCAYPGTPPSEMSSPMNDPVEITGVSGVFRRATAQGSSLSGTQTYTICDKKSDSWGFPTQFGYITYETPASPSESMLTTMDLMLASVKK